MWQLTDRLSAGHCVRRHAGLKRQFAKWELAVWRCRMTSDFQLPSAML